MRRAIIIPHYNTPEQLGTLLQNIPEEQHRDVLIIDDHSVRPPTNVVGCLYRHTSHRGYGAAQKTGYRWAIDRGYDQMLLVHGDNQYSFPHIWNAAPHVTDLALGSRLLGKASQMPKWRRMGNYLLTNTANVLFDKNHSDLHSGARIFSANLLNAIPFERFSDGFLFDQQILSYCFKRGIPIQEFPIPADYSDGVSSISLMPSIRYGIGCLFTLLQTKLNSDQNEQR